MKLVLLWSAVLIAHPAFACKCERLLGVCQEVDYSNVVFIGTVESISPGFLSSWNQAARPIARELNAANEKFQADRSPANFAALKNSLRKLLPDLSPEDRRRLESATTPESLTSLFSSVLGQGLHVRFRVRTVFRHSDDDDAKDAKDDKDDDDIELPKSGIFDVWTPSDDCGFDFQIGETYLVYADDDEETNVMETGSCSRTKRLTDAGADLSYLYFYKDRKHPSTRLEGFTTFDPLYQVKQSVLHDPDRIESPAPGVIVELQSDRGSRFTTSDASGKFVFDGLDEGDYKVAGYSGGFPESIKLLAPPKPLHVDARSCAAPVLLIPKP